MWSFLHSAALALQLTSLVWVCWLWWHDDHPLAFWNPLAIVVAFFGVYFVVGPLVGAAVNGSEHLGRDFSELLPLGWLSGAIGVTAITSGFLLFSRKSSRHLSVAVPVTVQGLVPVAYGLLGFGIIGTFLWIRLGDIGLSIAAFELGDSVGIGEGAAKVNYLYHTINFFIAATFILFAIKRRLSFPILIITILVLAFYAAVGFRYRIAIFLIGMFVLHHLMRRRSPNIVLLTVSGFLALLLMGVISRFRTYWGGLNFDLQEDTSLGDIVLSALGETNTFYGLCAVLDAVPASIDFAYFEPLEYIFVLPIPRFVWPEKPSPEYLQKVYESIGTADAWLAGTAVPSIGEYYLAFGWLGIVFGGLLFGVFLAWIWTMFLRHSEDPRWNVLYALFFPFFYYMMSRGYLAQLVQDFVFTLGPALVMFILCKPRQPLYPPRSVQSTGPHLNTRMVTDDHGASL